MFNVIEKYKKFNILKPLKNYGKKVEKRIEESFKISKTSFVSVIRLWFPLAYETYAKRLEFTYTLNEQISNKKGLKKKTDDL